MHFFFITLGILFILGAIKVLYNEHPSATVRLAKIVGMIVLIITIIVGIFVGYLLAQQHQYDLERTAEKKLEQHLIQTVERHVQNGGQIADFDDEILTFLVESYRDLTAAHSDLADQIEKIRVSKLPKHTTVDDEAKQELEILNSTSKFPQAVQTK